MNNEVGFIWVVTGTDENGVWYLGTGNRKVAAVEAASHFSAKPVAEKYAVKLGGYVARTPLAT